MSDPDGKGAPWAPTTRLSSALAGHDRLERVYSAQVPLRPDGGAEVEA